ncbi:sensor histidine kinase [Maricaulis sp. D1M11]
MRKVTTSSEPAALIRRRDIAAVASIGGVVLLVLAFSGGLEIAAAIVGTATIAAIATIYYLVVRTSLELEAQDLDAQPEGDVVGVPPGAPDHVALTMLEELPVPVLLIGAGGRVERANPAARDFLGLGQERVSLSSVLRQPKVLEGVGAALRGEASRPVEYSMLDPVESHVRAHVAPLAFRPDDPNGWWAMVVLFDETSVKRADRMRADFLANASHELRTPLASLSGFIETLRGHAKDDTVARDRFLGIMQDQAERMQRLINDLLSLSRVEMDEHVLPDGTASLDKVTEDVIAFLRPQIEEKQIDMQLEAGAGLCASGDRDQLTEVIQNLIENAIKYSPSQSRVDVKVEGGLTRDQAERPEAILGEGSSRLTLAAPASETGASYVAVRVRDEGKGIDRRFLPRLAERFYRVDGQKSGPKEGTGLGLAIVKHIINRHRGGFTVESAMGVGSVFSVFVPLCSELKSEDITDTQN